MKICAIICEFNPFHNGHKYLIEQAKKLSGCDLVLCIMSGGFTQRGDICVADKYTRARHAVYGGADVVLELPAAFAVAPAEIFASGAVKILSSIPEVAYLAFGCENPDGDFKKAAGLLLSESQTFKTALRNTLESGESYIKSYAAAFQNCGGDEKLVANPNNVLGVEYAKAILRCGDYLKILPIQRVGAGFNDGTLLNNFSSASAIRKNIGSPEIKNNVPDFVYGDLTDAENIENAYKEVARAKLFFTDGENLARISGCGEGLENALKNLQNENFDEIIEKSTSRRYSSARIRRILCANLLNLYEENSKRYLGSELYFRTLAVKKERADDVLGLLSRAEFPLLADGSFPVRPLSENARECLATDKYAHSLWSFIARRKVNDKMIIVN